MMPDFNRIPSRPADQVTADFAVMAAKPDLNPGDSDLITSADSDLITSADIEAADMPERMVDQRVGQPSLEAAKNVTPITTLFSDNEVGELRSRWSNVQAGFVDEPRRSVEEADQLVATVMQRLAEGFANERASLEQQWDSGDNVSTEDLRVALQRYRAFFGRLLNAA